jgi:hypothetical protein
MYDMLLSLSSCLAIGSIVSRGSTHTSTHFYALHSSARQLATASRMNSAGMMPRSARRLSRAAICATGRRIGYGTIRSRFSAGRRRDAKPSSSVDPTETGKGCVTNLRSWLPGSGTTSRGSIGASTGVRRSRMGVRSTRASSRAWARIGARLLAIAESPWLG